MKTTFVANSDYLHPTTLQSAGNPRDNSGTRREQVTEYRLVFTLDKGMVSEDGKLKLGSEEIVHRQDWMSMMMGYVMDPAPGVTLSYPVYSPSALSRIDDAEWDRWRPGMPQPSVHSNSNTHVTYERLHHLGLRKN